MEKLNPEDSSEVKKVISKLIESRRFSDLSASDVALLSEFSGKINSEIAIEQSKTLLFWIWDNLIKYENYAAKFSRAFDVSMIDCVILPERKKLYSYNPSVEAVCSLLTRQDLLAAVEKSLQLFNVANFENHERITGALLLAGLAGLTEFENELVDFSSKEKYDSISYSSYADEFMAASFISLNMLGSQSVERVLSRLKSVHEESLRPAIFMYYDMNPDKITESEIKEYGDFFADYNDALYFPNLTIKLLNDNIPALNNLISAHGFTSEDNFVWKVVCPAIFLPRNEDLLQSIIDENENQKIYQILLAAVLNNANWIIPFLFKQITKVEEEADSVNFLSIVPYYIFTASLLSEGDCDWLRTFFQDNDEKIRISAILSCVNKDNLINDLTALKSNKDRLTSGAIAFVLAQAKDSPLEYLDSLIIEMKACGLDIGLASFIRSAMKMKSKKTPPELEDIWYMSGPSDLKDAANFYKKYPYRLMKWLFNRNQNPFNSFQLFSFTKKEITERSLIVLKDIVDGRFTGLIKSFLYTVDDDSASVIALGILSELEKNGLSKETKVLKKIFMNSDRTILEFEDNEFFYALLFYFYGNKVKRPDVLRGLKEGNEVFEIFLRLLLETQTTSDDIDAVVYTRPPLKTYNDPLFRLTGNISNLNSLGSLDEITFSRLVSISSDKVRAQVIENSNYPGASFSDSPAGEKQSLNNEDLYLLLFLLGDFSSATTEAALTKLSENLDRVGWLKESINRWLHLDRDLGNSDSLADAGLLCASKIKSAEYLPEFIKLLSSDHSYGAEEKFLDVIEDILKANPEFEFIFLRADDEEKLKKAYNLVVKREYDFDSDNKAKCIKLLSVIFSKFSDRNYAAKHKGKIVSINHETDHLDPTLAQKCLTRAEFEKLALYLTVTYTDDNSGLIFAEVMDPSVSEPSAEIFNAILQTNNYAIFTVSWS